MHAKERVVHRVMRWSVGVGAGLGVSVLVLAPAPVVSPSPAAAASSASPDPAFGRGDGLTLLDTSLREVVEAVLPLPDGRTLVVGTDIEGSAVFVARLKADGTPDSTFGTGGGGARLVPLGDRVTAAGAVLEPDGRVVIAGTAGFTRTDFVVFRLTAAGDLDPSFGTGGQVRIDAGDIDQAFALARQADGAVVVAGRGGEGGRSAVVARVTAAGAIDAGFGQGGVVATTFGADSAELQGVGVEPAGGVVVGGLTAGADEVRPLIARLTATGAPDAGYGDAGRVDPASLPLRSVADLAVDASGRAVAVGPRGPEDAVQSVVSRVTAGGAVDPTFGTGGATTVSVARRTVLRALTVDGHGRVLVSGLANPTGHLPAGLAFAVVARLTTAGGLDPSFGCGGTARFDVPAEGGGSAAAVAVGPAGHVLLGGLAFLDDDIDIPRSDSLVIRLGPPPNTGAGFVLAREDGGTSPLGAAPPCGSLSGTALNRPVVAAARTVTGRGYWLAASDGGVFGFGDAAFAGSTGHLSLNRPVVGMAADPDGAGYWLVASDGGIFAFDAGFAGSTGDIRLNSPIVTMAADPDGAGYWLVASDGGVFAFDAPFPGAPTSPPFAARTTAAG